MILLTGSTGFIGKHLVEFIKHNFTDLEIVALTNQRIENVRCIPHENHSYNSLNFPTEVIDQIEVVIHLGAFIPKARDEANDWLKCGENIFSTESLLKLNLTKLKRFIFISSIDVYANIKSRIDENSNTHPQSLYGWSKLYCEKMVLAFCEKNEIDTLILRLGHVYGPGEELYQKLIPSTMRSIIAGKSPLVYGDGSDLRSLIYVGDVVKAIGNSIVNSIDERIINVVHEQSFSIVEIVNKIIEVSGKEVAIIYKNGSYPQRDIVFNNTRFKEKLLSKVLTLDEGLREEWNHISGNEKDSI